MNFTPDTVKYNYFNVLEKVGVLYKNNGFYYYKRIDKSKLIASTPKGKPFEEYDTPPEIKIEGGDKK